VSEKYSTRELVSRHKLDAKLHCKTPFGAYCEVHTDPDITNTMKPRTRWGICLGPTGNLQGSHKFMSLTTGKRIVRHKFTEMPLSNSVKKQVAKWASKDHTITGLKFMDKHGIEYKFNKEEDAIIEERPIDIALFPDVLAEAPGIMTQYENLINGEDIIEGKPASNNKKQAMLAAENSGLEIGPTNKSRATGEVIQLLDDNKVDVLDDKIRHDEEVKMKEEPHQAKITDQDEEDHNEDHVNETGVEQPRRLGREQACPKRFEDYEVYVTVEEEDEFMLTTCADNDVVSTDKNDDRASEAVAHYIMMHYEETAKLKKRKKKYKPKDRKYSLDAGHCHFDDRAETAVTKELRQFNTYEVFMPMRRLGHGPGGYA
jgi:hypothetical protein